jgi:hypothetical protein
MSEGGAMKMIRLIVGLMVLGLAGCAMGVKDDGSNARQESLHMSVSFQDSYRRADAYARHCHTSNSLWKGSFNVDGDLFTDIKQGVVRVNMPNNGRDLERFEIAATGLDESEVKITMWDVGAWDDREMTAAKRSITTGIPVCRKDIL